MAYGDSDRYPGLTGEGTGTAPRKRKTDELGAGAALKTADDALGRGMNAVQDGFDTGVATAGDAIKRLPGQVNRATTVDKPVSGESSPGQFLGNIAERARKSLSGMPRVAEMGVPFDAADGRQPAITGTPTLRQPRPDALPTNQPVIPAFQAGPPIGEPVTRYNGNGSKTLSIQHEDGTSSARTVPGSMVTGTDRIAVNAQAQQPLTGSPIKSLGPNPRSGSTFLNNPTNVAGLQARGNITGTTRGNGYEFTGTAGDAAAFMAPTGVNAETTAAMQGQFARMNASNGSGGPTRTPSLHADEGGPPKMLTLEERKAAGIGWKTGAKMYDAQMQEYGRANGQTAAMNIEQMRERGAGSRALLSADVQNRQTNSQGEIARLGLTQKAAQFGAEQQRNDLNDRAERALKGSTMRKNEMDIAAGTKPIIHKTAIRDQFGQVSEETLNQVNPDGTFTRLKEQGKFDPMDYLKAIPGGMDLYSKADDAKKAEIMKNIDRLHRGQ